MKSKLALLLATLLFFNIILPFRVHAAVVPDISQVTAVWDSNIDTSWDHVYNEYKTLDPQSRYEADKVIAANAYRFLISIGSKPLEGLNQQKFDDFLRAVSPFNIAYNNVLAEQVVHAAWTISGEQYKVFCANVIHNIASNPDYFNTHVIKNDPFVNGAGQQSLQVYYNDVDYNQQINIFDNIFNGKVLSSTNSSIGVFFNPLPLYYTGTDITLSSLNSYFSFFNDGYYNVFSANPSRIKLNGSTQLDSSYLYLQHFYINNYPKDCFQINATIRIYDDLSEPYVDFVLSTPDNTSGYSYYKISLLSSNYYSNVSCYTYQNYIFFKNPFDLTINYNRDFLKNFVSTYYYDLVKDYLVYTPYFYINAQIYRHSNYSYDNFTYNFIPDNSYYSFVSPQFQPVNIYNNQYYGSDDDTYFHIDQMVDNIINNDYSTVNNGSNNTFYNDNYYITQPVTGGGIELVTSSSIVYNYITIINNGGGTSSGGSIGSYPYPFDVRIINPEDIKNETETNTQNQIINNYDFDINAGDLTSTITTVKNTAVNNLNEVAPSSGTSIGWVKNMFLVIPSDLMKILLTFLIVGIIVCVYHSR